MRFMRKVALSITLIALLSFCCTANAILIDDDSELSARQNRNTANMQRNLNQTQMPAYPRGNFRDVNSNVGLPLETRYFDNSVNKMPYANPNSNSQYNMGGEYGQMAQPYDSIIEMPFKNNAAENAFSNNYQSLNSKNGYQYQELSGIEKLFNGDEINMTNVPLMQVGYDLFAPQITGGNERTGKFDDNYKFSIGERVNAYLYGDSVDIMAISGSNLLSPVVQTEVDSKGNIFIIGIGLTPAENRSISEVERAINAAASKKYKSLKIKLSVASGQDFSVFVYGQVNKPGKVTVNNNSSITDALGAAGGVKKTGTLRKIKYTSGKATRDVDLYKALFQGNDDNIILRPNDKIFVGPIGSVAAIKNGVGVNGIYEIKEGETLQNLITYAGGLLPGTETDEVTLTSLDTKTKQRHASNVSFVEASRTKLKNGDMAEFRELYNVAENTVVLQGNIKHPATFAYKDGMHLSDILKSEDELLEETFITQAVIRRVSGKNNTIETIPVFLKEFFQGMNDPLLQPRDIINIYKNTNSDFVDVYGCITMPKHITYKENMTLGDILTEIQFVDSVDAETNNETNVSFTEDDATGVLSAGTTNSNRIISAENVAVEITGQDNFTRLYYLYDIMINGNKINEILLLPSDKVFFRALREGEMVKNVRVSGFVKHPGVYKFVEGKTLKDMIELAGGLDERADLRGTVFIRKNLQASQSDLAIKNNERDIKLIEGRLAGGYRQTESEIESRSDMINTLKEEGNNMEKRYTGQIALDIKSNDLDKIKSIDNLQIQDGDEIYIPRISNHVSVIGEVYNEQSFVYRKGTKVKQYIKEVGGYTPNASKFRLYKVGVNGRAEKVHGWTKIAEGDTIVVPRKISGNDWLTPICDALKGIASIISTAFVVTRW